MTGMNSARLIASVVLLAVVALLAGGCVSETRTVPLPPGTHSMKSAGGSM
ncbi:MAG: hypothetical protein JWM57_1207 [Phycisphaerales bacterium]|nr:hypothetical protein [Phycisphaerales bacterium]